MHLGLNLAWLIPFGTALARRFGTWRYTVFMLVMAAIGALAHLVSHVGEMEPMIGASAAISGAMAAAMRFVFQHDGPLAHWRERSDEAYRVPAASLAATLRDPRFLLFLAVWLGLNALFGLGTISFGTEAGQEIAWQAHVGGFFAGLLLFDAFDPVVPRAELDTEPSGLSRFCNRVAPRGCRIDLRSISCKVSAGPTIYCGDSTQNSMLRCTVPRRSADGTRRRPEH